MFFAVSFIIIFLFLIAFGPKEEGGEWGFNPKEKGKWGFGPTKERKWGFDPKKIKGEWDKNNPLFELFEYYFHEFWRRSTDFTGKTKRKDFWMAELFHTLIIILLYIILFLFRNEYLSIQRVTTLIIIYLIASFIPNSSIQVRRLRDIGKEPEFVFLSLIPFANLILLFWFSYPSNTDKSIKSSIDYSITKTENNINKKMDEIEIKLERLKTIHNKGLISDEEYNSAKKQALNF